MRLKCLSSIRTYVLLFVDGRGWTGLAWTGGTDVDGRDGRDVDGRDGRGQTGRVSKTFLGQLSELLRASIAWQIKQNSLPAEINFDMYSNEVLEYEK